MRFRGHGMPGRRSSKNTGLEEDTSLVSRGIRKEQVKCTEKPVMERGQRHSWRSEAEGRLVPKST